MAQHNDNDLKDMLRAAQSPSPDPVARHRAADAAWNAFVQRNRGERRGLLSVFGSSPVLASILIITGLFGTLSYSVSQSTRSGAGDTASETNLISSSQLTQYPAGVRTAVVRMLIAGIKPEELLFNPTSDFEKPAFNSKEILRRSVFHPDGGNATYQYAPADVMDNSTSGTWFFNANAQVMNIGITGSGIDNTGNDIVAFLPHIVTGICRRMNEETGLSPFIPTDDDFNLADLSQVMADVTGPDADSFPARAAPVLNGTNNELAGAPFGCFQAKDGTNVYYHVIIER